MMAKRSKGFANISNKNKPNSNKTTRDPLLDHNKMARRISLRKHPAIHPLNNPEEKKTPMQLPKVNPREIAATKTQAEADRETNPHHPQVKTRRPNVSREPKEANRALTDRTLIRIKTNAPKILPAKASEIPPATIPPTKTASQQRGPIRKTQAQKTQAHRVAIHPRPTTVARTKRAMTLPVLNRPPNRQNETNPKRRRPTQAGEIPVSSPRKVRAATRQERSGSESPSGGESGSESPQGSGTSSEQSPETGKPASENKATPTGSGSSSTSESAGGTLGEDAPPTPPSPADMEYAKKATDMVLDYLKQTRDAPDQELMDKLNWTEDDLRRFSDRWQRARELQQANDANADPVADWEETLKSLGLRNPETKTRDSREAADSLRSLRDSGNRKPPPPAHRDAFDAFRRAIGRQK